MNSGICKADNFSCRNQPGRTWAAVMALRGGAGAARGSPLGPRSGSRQKPARRGRAGGGETEPCPDGRAVQHVALKKLLNFAATIR